MQWSAGRAKTGKLSTPKATGRCVCGDVKFEIDYPAFWAWHDHSDASRRAQGCAYATYVGTWRKPISRLTGIRTHHPVRRTEDARKKKLLRPMRDAPILRTRERAKVGEHSPRTVFGTHGP